PASRADLPQGTRQRSVRPLGRDPLSEALGERAMSPEGSLTVFALTLVAIVFGLLSVETRSLVRSMYWYIAHSCCLILIYTSYALFVRNPYLFVWAGLCVVNTWILPFLKGGL